MNRFNDSFVSQFLEFPEVDKPISKIDHDNPIVGHLFDECGKLNQKVITNLKRNLEIFHSLFDIPCQDRYSENLYHRAMLDAGYDKNHVIWHKNSHGTTDIELRYPNHKPFHLSMKSGLQQKRNLRISGFRLSKYEGDMHQINEHLKKPSEDLVISMNGIEQKDSWTYVIQYIPSDIFTYPNSGQAWEEHGKHYKHTMDNGIDCFIFPKMSYQIWWEIPYDLLTNYEKIEIRQK